MGIMLRKFIIYNLQCTIKTALLIFTFYILHFTFYIAPVYAADCNIGLDCPAGLPQIEQLFTRIISIMAGLGFVVLLVMLVWAGFKYLTSGGEQKAIAQAHQVVTWALLGIVFMAVAWLILQLIHTFTGINVTIFNINVLPQ